MPCSRRWRSPSHDIYHVYHRSSENSATILSPCSALTSPIANEMAEHLVNCKMRALPTKTQLLILLFVMHAVACVMLFLLEQLSVYGGGVISGADGSRRFGSVVRLLLTTLRWWLWLSETFLRSLTTVNTLFEGGKDLLQFTRACRPRKSRR